MKSLNSYINEGASVDELSMVVTISCSEHFKPTSKDFEEGAREYYNNGAKSLISKLEKYGDVIQAEITDGQNVIDCSKLRW